MERIALARSTMAPAALYMIVEVTDYHAPAMSHIVLLFYDFK